MPTDRTIAIPLANYPSGTRTLSERDLPDWANQFSFELRRCTLADQTIWNDPAVTIDMSFEVEVGGAWISGGRFVSRGGIVNNPERGEQSACSAMYSLPAGTNRRIKGSVTIAGGVLRTEGTLELAG